MDVNGNLSFGQWLTGIYFKKNKTFKSQKFLNEENHRLIELHETERKIIPWLKFDKKLFSHGNFEDYFYSKGKNNFWS